MFNFLLNNLHIFSFFKSNVFQLIFSVIFMSQMFLRVNNLKTVVHLFVYLLFIYINLLYYNNIVWGNFLILVESGLILFYLLLILKKKNFFFGIKLLPTIMTTSIFILLNNFSLVFSEIKKEWFSVYSNFTHSKNDFLGILNLFNYRNSYGYLIFLLVFYFTILIVFSFFFKNKKNFTLKKNNGFLENTVTELTRTFKINKNSLIKKWFFVLTHD